MALPREDLRLKILPEAKRVLQVMATIDNRDITAIAAEKLETLLLGEAHKLRVTAETMRRCGIDGITRE